MPRISREQKTYNEPPIEERKTPSSGVSTTSASEKNEPNYEIRVLHRAIDILECFTANEKELSLLDLAEKSKLDYSTVRRIAVTLTKRNLLKKNTTGTYQLGLKLFEMGSMVTASFFLREAAVAPLAAIEKQIRGTILLARRDGDHFILIERREYLGDGGMALVSIPARIGTIRPLTYGPIGRAMMSTLSESDIARLLELFPLQAYSPNSITDVEVFQQLLRRAKEQKFAMDVNELVEGIASYAVPLLDFSGTVAGAISLCMPVSMINDTSYIDNVVTHLLETGSAISANMGYTPPRDR